MPTLRVLTYNVRSMRDDRAALARVIRDAEAHVVCVQEAPRFARWRALCAQLARTSGMVVVGGGRPAAANLIMSTLAVDVQGLHCVRFSRDPGLHRRGAAVALLRYSGAAFALAGTHLDLRPGPRLRHVGELHRGITEHVPAGMPTIVAGDINDDPGSAVWQALCVQRLDAFAQADGGRGADAGFTSTATEPRRRIDAIFVDPRITVRSAEVLDGDDVRVASDHRPLLAELDLPG